MRKLWGRDTSINVQKVVWVLQELGLEYERVDVGGIHGGLQSEKYLALNPQKKIPTLEDGDAVFWESNAITRYLVDAYGTNALRRASPQERGQADMWVDWYQNNVYTAFQIVFHHSVKLPQRDRDPRVLQENLDHVHAQFALAENALQAQPYLAGSTLSLGDIPFASCLYRYYTMELARPDFPAISSYYARLKQHPPYRDAVMINYDSLRAPD